MLAFIVQNAGRAQIDHLLKLGGAYLEILLAQKTHRYQPFGIDIEHLGRGLVLVAVVLVIISVWVLDRQANQIAPEALRGTVRPGEFGKEDHFYTHGLDARDRLLQFCKGAQARIGIVRRVALVLAAVVPTDQLNGAHAVPGAFFANLHKIAEAHPQFVFGRVDVHLLPGMRLAGPIRGARRAHPGAAPAFVDVRTALPTASIGFQHHRGQRPGFTRLNIGNVYSRKTQIDIMPANLIPRGVARFERTGITRAQFGMPGDQFVIGRTDPGIQALTAAAQQRKRHHGRAGIV